MPRWQCLDHPETGSRRSQFRIRPGEQLHVVPGLGERFCELEGELEHPAAREELHQHDVQSWTDLGVDVSSGSGGAHLNLCQQWRDYERRVLRHH